MTILKTIIFMLGNLFLAACSTGYHEENMFGGFSDSHIGENTAVVRFDGNSETSYRQARNYALNRAAQITLDDGYDYFIVTSITGMPVDVDVNASHDSDNGVTTPPKLYTTYYHATDFQSVDYSPSSTMRCENCLAKTHGVVAVIKMFQGHKPVGVPMAYDARDVISHIGPSTF
jgi:hypothetical protein